LSSLNPSVSKANSDGEKNGEDGCRHSGTNDGPGADARADATNGRRSSHQVLGMAWLHDWIKSSPLAVVGSVCVDAVLVFTWTILNAVALIYIDACVLVHSAVVSFITAASVTTHIIVAVLGAAAIVHLTLVDRFTVCSINGFVCIGSAEALVAMGGVATEHIAEWARIRIVPDTVSLCTGAVEAVKLYRHAVVVTHIRTHNLWQAISWGTFRTHISLISVSPGKSLLADSRIPRNSFGPRYSLIA
jgi:hypothetical protein